jgi:hypothetical protein
MRTQKSPAEVLSREQDLRRAPRRDTRDLAIVTIGRNADARAGESFPVQLHDLSMRGARFSGMLPLTRGESFVLYLPSTQKRVALLATAVHVGANTDGQITVGAEFTGVVNATQKEEMPPCIEEAELARIRATMLGM